MADAQGRRSLAVIPPSFSLCGSGSSAVKSERFNLPPSQKPKVEDRASMSSAPTKGRLSTALQSPHGMDLARPKY